MINCKPCWNDGSLVTATAVAARQGVPSALYGVCDKHQIGLDADVELTPLTYKKSMGEFSKEAHHLAIEKGWWEGCGTLEAGVSPEMAKTRLVEILLMCHSEISEAVDEYRNRRMETYWVIPRYERKNTEDVDHITEAAIRKWGQDALTEDHRMYSWRQLDHVGRYCGMKPIRDVGAPVEYAEEIIKYLRAKEKPEGFGIEVVDNVIRSIELLYALGYDVDDLVKIKHTYNGTRPYRHGNKVI